MGAALTCFEASTGGIPAPEHAHHHGVSEGSYQPVVASSIPLEKEKAHHHHHQHEEKKEGFFDSIHSSIGRSMADSLRSEENQERIGKGLESAAKNKDTQRQMAHIVGENSDSALVKTMVQNEQVQDAMGNAVASMASNKEVQRAVANSLAAAAEDKETQKKVASAIWSGTKNTSSFLADVAVGATKAYIESQEHQEHHS